MFEELLEHFKENFMNMVTSRLLVLMLVITGMGGYLIYWIFQLQIVNGEQYYNDFQLKIRKERTLPATRGNILDRDGNLLAYNELAYSVTIEDVYELVRSRLAPRGVVSRPVPWKFSPVSGFWNSGRSTEPHICPMDASEGRATPARRRCRSARHTT